MAEVLFKRYLYFEAHINDNTWGWLRAIKKLEILHRSGGEIEHHLVFITKHDEFKGDIHHWSNIANFYETI